MEVLHCHIARIRQPDQAGLVSANVHLMVRDSPTCKPRGLSISVSVAANDPAIESSLRQEAIAMAHKMSRLEKLYQEAISIHPTHGEADIQVPRFSSEALL
ncbi:hypothetical protein [Loktanella sp. S4079]|uniref:hypothetical protein n=1 Tax=Loktanella sp. S4079 TaxID=579483 RepID=UPI0005FA074F|nr:hypothetical protein [Loktanella sp. S4079]KJZ21092.1 hypothetical protein TW80_00035 [Loktanella sp. S4079]